MGRVVVRYNYLPAIIKELPKAVDKEVDETGRAMARDLAQAVWYLYGWVRQATFVKTIGENHAEVVCGINRGHGFYSRFNEWGTIYQAPRPIVGPTAHTYEPIYARRMAEAVRRACAER